MSSAPTTLSTLPPIQSLPLTHHTALLDTLFERSQPLHTLSLPLLSTPTFKFDSYDALIRAVEGQLKSLHQSPSTSDTEWLDSILRAHPRIGEKRVDSALSRREQAAMMSASASATNSNKDASTAAQGGESHADADADAQRETEEQAEELRRLNAAYEERFPGLIYMVFVDGRSRGVIMEDMRRRITRGDVVAEREECIKVSRYPFLPFIFLPLQGKKG